MDCFGQSGWCGEILSDGVECRCQRGAYCRWIVADKGQKECSFELSDWRTWSNGQWLFKNSPRRVMAEHSYGAVRAKAASICVVWRWRCSAIEFGVEQHVWTMPSAPSALSHVANKRGCDLFADSGSLASAWVSLSKTPENVLQHAQGPFQASGGCVQIACHFKILRF